MDRRGFRVVVRRDPRGSSKLFSIRRRPRTQTTGSSVRVSGTKSWLGGERREGGVSRLVTNNQQQAEDHRHNRDKRTEGAQDKTRSQEERTKPMGEDHRVVKGTKKKRVRQTGEALSGGEHVETTSRDREPEHRALGLRLRQLEAEGKRGTAGYKEASQRYLEALHRRLREVGCDLSDGELRSANKPDVEGEIALHKCVYEYFALASGARGATTGKRMEHCVRKAKALCEAGAKVNHRNKYGDTPLLAAAQTDAADVARVLLEYGADLTVRNRQGYTPLLMAASENRPAAVAAIAPAMAQQRRDQLDALSGGYAALHWACINNSPKMVAALLKAKADKNILTDPDRHTPLHKAAAYNAAACLEQLLRARADVAALDADGRTALHHAAKHKATLCVQLLLSAGANPDVLDHHNQKPIYYAAVAKSKATVAALSAGVPNFNASPDGIRVKLLLQGKRVADDDEDDHIYQDDSLWGGCFGSAGGCF